MGEFPLYIRFPDTIPGFSPHWVSLVSRHVNFATQTNPSSAQLVHSIEVDWFLALFFFSGFQYFGLSPHWVSGFGFSPHWVSGFFPHWVPVFFRHLIRSPRSIPPVRNPSRASKLSDALSEQNMCVDATMAAMHPLQRGPSCLFFGSCLASTVVERKPQAPAYPQHRLLPSRPTFHKPPGENHRGTSLIRNTPPVGPYSSPMHRDLR